MSSKAKAKGTRAETAVVRYMVDHGITAKRKPLAGSNDEGDVELVDGSGFQWCIEVKAGKQTANPSRAQMEEWRRQALVEMANSEAERTALVVVRYRRKLCDADVWMLWEDLREHMYLDEFAEYLKGE